MPAYTHLSHSIINLYYKDSAHRSRYGYTHIHTGYLRSCVVAIECLLGHNVVDVSQDGLECAFNICALQCARLDEAQPFTLAKRLHVGRWHSCRDRQRACRVSAWPCSVTNERRGYHEHMREWDCVCASTGWWVSVPGLEDGYVKKTACGREERASRLHWNKFAAATSTQHMLVHGPVRQRARQVGPAAQGLLSCSSAPSHSVRC